MNAPAWYNVANLFLLFGTLNNIYALIRNRNQLKGFSIAGATTTLIGCSCIAYGYIVEGFWVTMILMIPTLAYWGIVSVYTFWIQGKWVLIRITRTLRPTQNECNFHEDCTEYDFERDDCKHLLCIKQPVK